MTYNSPRQRRSFHLSSVAFTDSFMIFFGRTTWIRFVEGAPQPRPSGSSNLTSVSLATTPTKTRHHDLSTATSYSVSTNPSHRRPPPPFTTAQHGRSQQQCAPRSPQPIYSVTNLPFVIFQISPWTLRWSNTPVTPPHPSPLVSPPSNRNSTPPTGALRSTRYLKKHGAFY